LADRLFDDATSGEADGRTGFGDDDVRLEGEGRRHAAGRRIGQHRDEQVAVGHEALDGLRGLGHLHQCEHTLFHARAAARSKDDARQTPPQRLFQEIGDAFAHDRAHRAAAEIEVHHAERHREAVERRKAGDHRLRQFRFLAVRFELGRIGTPVGPAQRVRRQNFGADLDEVGIDQRVDAVVRVHAEVIAAPRADVGVGAQILAVQHLAALRTLLPERRVLGRDVLIAPDAQPLGNGHQAIFFPAAESAAPAELRGFNRRA
jgi:hypothetical protein